MVKIRNNGPTMTTLGLLFQRGYWYEVSDGVAKRITSKSANFELEQEEGSPSPVLTSLEEEIIEVVAEEVTVDIGSMTKKQLQEYLSSLGITFKKLDSKTKLQDLAFSLDEEE